MIKIARFTHGYLEFDGKTRQLNLVVEKENMYCSKHPQYRAERPPRADCCVCQMMWARRAKNEESLRIALGELRRRASRQVDKPEARSPKGTRPPDSKTKT